MATQRAGKRSAVRYVEVRHVNRRIFTIVEQPETSLPKFFHRRRGSDRVLCLCPFEIVEQFRT